MSTGKGGFRLQPNHTHQVGCTVTAMVPMQQISGDRVIVQAIRHPVEGDRIVPHHRFGMAIPGEREAGADVGQQQEMNHHTFHQC